jgi:hypothetical protein
MLVIVPLLKKERKKKKEKTVPKGESCSQRGGEEAPRRASGW